MSDSWTNEWTTFKSNKSNNIILEDINNPNEKLDGFDLPRKLWIRLNRIRSMTGRCADSFHKWGIMTSASCDCGEPKQTIRHIVSECPLRSYGGSMTDFIKLTPNSLQWFENLDIEI